jgi:Ca2+/Na+ antiporter
MDRLTLYKPYFRRIMKMVKHKEESIVHILIVLNFVLILGIFLLLYFVRVLELHSVLEIVVTIIVALIVIYICRHIKKTQTAHIAITAKYLLEKEETMMDELLGILISGKWDKMKIDPIKEFFNALKKLCLASDYEMRRRISEALPALLKIDVDETKELVQLLRRDWDTERWRSDNRRRTIESLSYILEEGEIDFVKECLNIIDGDEIFTLIAIAEIIDFWRKEIDTKEANNIFDLFITKMNQKEYSLDDINGIKITWRILYLIRIYPPIGITEIDNLKDDENIFVRLTIARNLKQYFDRYQDKVLNIIEWFLSNEKNKDVRRPLAREDNVGFVVNLMRQQVYNKRAKDILWKLINDEDEIIPITTLDKIDNIMDIDADFGIRILENVIKNKKNERLVRKAKNYMVRKLKIA